MLSLIILNWLPDTSVARAEPWMSLSFAMNLAYPILVNFGQFSGDLLRRWVDREMLRVIPPLAENERFNQAEFTANLHALEKRYETCIHWVNVVVVSWSLIAAFATFVIVLYGSFDPDAKFPGSVLLVLFLSASVPFGLFVMAIIYALASWAMKGLSIEHNGVLRLTETAPQQTIDKARKELQAKLKERRDDPNST